jgi:hypothetical protein
LRLRDINVYSFDMKLIRKINIGKVQGLVIYEKNNILVSSKINFLFLI